MEIGALISLDADIESRIAEYSDIGFKVLQLSVSDTKYLEKRMADKIRKACSSHGTSIVSIVVGGGEPEIWDFIQGPATIGIVPQIYRSRRIKHIIEYSDFAAELRIPDVIAHMGFIPEDPNDSNYLDVVSSIHGIASRLQTNGQHLLLETGQETPITLVRTINDAKARNIGINFDPANLLMYGKANPADAIELLAPYTRGVHAKDGEYPADEYHLGKEKPLGKGRVDFDKIIHVLRSQEYGGSIIIECEIVGVNYKEAALEGKVFLEEHMR